MLVVSPDPVFVFQRIDAFLIAETIIRAAEFDEFFRIRAVDRAALALDIGTEIPAHVGSFRIADARVLQGIVNDLHGAVDVALAVRIFEAENKIAPLFHRVQVAVQRGPQIADVHIARG